VTAAAEQAQTQAIDNIPGWFPWLDQRVFEHFLDPCNAAHGDLIELGVYLGKSAALIGRFQRADETFTVCDLFGDDAHDDPNRSENSRLYKDLTRQRFEQNYLALHSALPVIVQALSSTIVEHVRPHSVRFMHVDASHLYEHVAVDVISARALLQPDGVVVFDDYRSAHTPGVSAAVWEAIFTKGLQPICLTPQKLYATFGDAEPHQDRLETWLREWGGCHRETQQIAAAPVIRLIPQRTQMSSADELSTRSPGAVAAERFDRVATELNKVSKLVGSIDRRLSVLESRASSQRAGSPLSFAKRVARRARREIRALRPRR
jgi:hypothetical protein